MLCSVPRNIGQSAMVSVQSFSKAMFLLRDLAQSLYPSLVSLSESKLRLIIIIGESSPQRWRYFSSA